MFYLTKEDLIGPHTNQPPFPSPHPSTRALSPLPSPIRGEYTHIYTLPSLKHGCTNTHTRTQTHARSTCCHLLYVLSTILTEYIIHFTTIHHITFPQCHSLVLETEGEKGGGNDAHQWWREKNRESERFRPLRVRPENKIRWNKVVSKNCHDDRQ